ncbi:unnamed protein product [Bursaphelenchus xylophilus]|uniref:(pine wood nematode) hypothetical protein n=1 Tax=Bursaphelenchus xylophilus TaxID=6326 RepID=A0A1I7RRL3_BURXY|nr:unnamed protein product [Bursaphelenchus xylophilus]CAG9131096.1 unnamed protein product [Bursaphelenchus xylophilus]
MTDLTPDRTSSRRSDVHSSPAPSVQNIDSTSSAVVCRICQSETGQMVRPCACDGSMGTIHEKCLNQWWDTSGKDMCEICLTKYARTGRVLKPIRQWSKPHITFNIVYEIGAVLSVCTSIYQMFMLIHERKTLERLQLGGSSGPRTHDWVRFLTLTVLIFALLLLMLRVVRKTLRYIRHQYVVRFTEHQIHRQREQKAKN